MSALLPRVRLALLVIVAFYVAFGVAFARRTPLWQSPDEPAHYNYVRFVAEEKRLPELRPGDYDQEQLEELTSHGFPADVPTKGLAYENHQPPLYYLLAAPVYRAFAAAAVETRVLALRLISVALGTGLLMAAYLIVRRTLPRQPVLALATVGLMATIPQHIHLSASVNNDTLAELLLALLLLGLVTRMHGQTPASGGPLAHDIGLGITLGLVLLTKTTIYLGLMLVPLGLLGPAALRHGLRRAWQREWRHLATIALVALAISGWWFLRNMSVYGLTDPTGLARHDAVVSGQPRLASLDVAAMRHFFGTSFQSFWAQFGWMAVPASRSVNLVLALLTLGAVVGLGGVVAGLRQQRFWWRPEFWPVVLLVTTLVLVAGQMALYNLRFIQPQGRYLYPALVSIAFLGATGWRELLAPRYRGWMLLVSFLGLLLLDYWAYRQLLPLLP